jgi:hypothetical protein
VVTAVEVARQVARAGGALGTGFARRRVPNAPRAYKRV